MSASDSTRKRLPVKPSEENLRKQAKRFARSSGASLSEAQHRLAREYGAKNWPELMHVVETMLRGADQLAYVKYDMEALPKAANQSDLARVKDILASGEFTQHDLDLSLGRVICGMGKPGDARWTIAQLLIEHGADPDGQYGSNYGPIVFAACEGIDVEGIRFLIEHGADVSFAPIDTKYGKACPLGHLLGTYVRGRNDAKHQAIELLLAHGAQVPAEVTPEVLTIHRGDARTLGEMIDKDRTLIRRTFRDMPYGNINLAGATLLHCAVEFGEIECIDAILSRYRDWGDLDMNFRAEVIEGIGGQTPIYHAINTNGDGNFATLEYLIGRNGRYIDMSVKATWRSYGNPQPVPLTPLEYAEKAKREMDPKWAHYKPRVDDEIALLRPFDRRAVIRKACEAGEIETVRAMLDAHPELLTGELWPGAIHKARSLELVRLLLDRGLDPNDCPAPRKPLHLATYYHLADVVELLVERGADVTYLNTLDETPLDLIGEYELHMNNSDDARRCRKALLNAGAKHRFHTAIRAGELELIEQMLDADPELVNTTKPWSGLLTAARTGQLEAAKLLLSRGAKVDGSNDKGNTPLWFACQSSANAEDRIAVAKLLIDAGADVNRRCEDGSTALHFAAWRGPLEMVKVLLDHGGRGWLGDDKGKTPADYARDNGVATDKDAILEVLTGLHIADNPFRDALAAIDAGDVDRLKQLLAGHPRLATDRLESDSSMTRGYFTKPTLLHFVANNPNRYPHMPPRVMESAEAIIDAGADVDAKTPHGMGGTTLALVASSEPAKQANLQVPLIELLVRNGADPSEGLHAAILHRYTDAVAAMIRLGAKHSLTSAAGMGEIDALRSLLKADPSDTDKLVAIWAAAMNGRAEAVDLLLDAGVDASARLPRPFEPTILHEAAWHNHRGVCERLVARGADLTLRDTQYNGTPADWARHAGHAELADWLGSCAKKGDGDAKAL